jgi:hypothetical protein
MSITTANEQNLKNNLLAVNNLTGSVAELHKLDPKVGLTWQQRQSLNSATEKARHLSYDIYQVALSICQISDEPDLSNSENQEKLQLIADAHRGLEDFAIALLVGDPNNDAGKHDQVLAIRQELRNNNFAQLFLRAEAIIQKMFVEPIQQTHSDIGIAAGNLLLNVYHQRLGCPTISASTPPSYLFTDRRSNYANNRPPIQECFDMGVAGILSRATKEHLDVIKSRREDDPAFEFTGARVFAAAMDKLRESERPGITGIDPQLARTAAAASQLR